MREQPYDGGSLFGPSGILTTDAEIEQWMTAPAEEALNFQRPLPDGTLKIVAAGEKEDQAA